jgi:SAM-dependent methyltransferase
VNFEGFDLCCPVCRADLESGPELSCRGCGRRFPVIAGIPDLRVFSDPYIGIEDDRKKGARLAERLDRETFSTLVDYYYSTTSVVPPRHARIYKRGLMAAGARAGVSLEGWERSSAAAPGGSLLEIGCGTAPLLVEAARRGYRSVGIDVAFRWLVVGKKRLAEAGVRVPLICACAEALPFREGTFERVAIDSAIEVVNNQSAAMREAHRVLAPDGRLFLSTPNRFSVGPDPHLGVPAGGFWPEALLAAVARRQGALPPKRNLLWAKSLMRLIRDAGFTGARLDLPQVAQAQLQEVSGMLRAAAGPPRHARANEPVP